MVSDLKNKFDIPDVHLLRVVVPCGLQRLVSLMDRRDKADE